ncbi:MAG: DUF2059 domain-containing protein [Alphaproteobacteria bacterium]|nr:DUF2059 domain-containing protein [Alphaproteobacteria bacterium]
MAPPTESAATVSSDAEQLPTSDMDRKIDLARQMHAIRPAREQIDMAVDKVSELLPDQDRAKFQIAVRRMIDYKALERHSIEAMAQVFTVDELAAMVDFYSKPEAQHISEKLEEYNKLIEPEVFRMLDAAMMEVRTGGG